MRPTHINVVLPLIGDVLLRVVFHLDFPLVAPGGHFEVVRSRFGLCLPVFVHEIIGLLLKSRIRFFQIGIFYRETAIQVATDALHHICPARLGVVHF